MIPVATVTERHHNELVTVSYRDRYRYQDLAAVAAVAAAWVCVWVCVWVMIVWLWVSSFVLMEQTRFTLKSFLRFRPLSNSMHLAERAVVIYKYPPLHAFWSYGTKELAQNMQASNESDKQKFTQLPPSTTLLDY